MARPKPCGNGDEVEADGLDGLLRVALQERLGCTGDAIALPVGQHLAQGILATTRLDLDEGEPCATARDEVDLADRRSEPAREDTIAFQTKKQGGCLLRPTTGRLARCPVQRSLLRS